jgi:hypothetical protein
MANQQFAYKWRRLSLVAAKKEKIGNAVVRLDVFPFKL